MNRDITTLPPVSATERSRYGAELSQFFDFFVPRDETKGIALMIHGGYWRSRYNLLHVSHLCAALASEGIATANLEYRRVGEAGGGWPGTYEDVLSGFDAAQMRLGNPMVVLGHSAGGHLALRLAADRNPSGIIALAPLADLQLAYEFNLSNGAVVEFLGGTPRTVPERYLEADPHNFPNSVPRCLVHGEKDETVPIALSSSYLKARATDRPEVKLLKLPEADHFDLIDPESSVWNVVLKAAKDFLGIGG